MAETNNGTTSTFTEQEKHDDVYPAVSPPIRDGVGAQDLRCRPESMQKGWTGTLDQLADHLASGGIR